MKNTLDYSFTRYLSAKKTVDDRALNRNVWTSLISALSSTSSGRRPKILEIGAGIGTMFERSLDWELFDEGEYTGLDAMEENVVQACGRIPEWAASRGYSVENRGAGQYCLRKTGREISARFEVGDIFEFLDQERRGSQWDLLIANAFLDLVDVASALPRILKLLNPGGIFYFTINFDGATIFQPEIEPTLDALIEHLYHQTMDLRTIAGKPSGDSQTGRHFFEHIRLSGAELLDAGSSDWVVFPGPNGYPADESFFLHFIINTIGCALKDHPAMDSTRLSDWVQKRHNQIDAGTLVYVAHQMDFLGRSKLAAKANTARQVN
jgi:SAM-dependent methyltransferase